jgi:hypothetical protein
LRILNRRANGRRTEAATPLRFPPKGDRNHHGGIMRRSQSALALFVFLGMASATQALTIDVPLDAGSWFTYPSPYQVAVPGNGSLTNNAEGHLVATKKFATGGSNWFLGRDTVDTYDLQGGTLQYQWKLNGKGVYAGTYNGLQTESHAGLAYYKPMTTHHSFSNSLLIPSDTWIYTEYKFTDVGHVWEYSIGTSGYGSTNLAHGTTPMAQASWTALAKARPFIWLGDNYAAGAYLEVAKMTVTAVPEPTTVALLLGGLAVIGGVARRRASA